MQKLDQLAHNRHYVRSARPFRAAHMCRYGRVVVSGVRVGCSSVGCLVRLARLQQRLWSFDIRFKVGRLFVDN
jgi:hypothetical protein